MLPEAIALSVILGFLSIELLGLYTGGLISAGYLAFYLEQPWRLASTALLALVTWGLVRLLGRAVILYGRRRFMAAVLIGMTCAWLLEKGISGAIPQDLRAVGYIIPGLMANDMLRQGAVKTLALTLLAALVVRLVLMAVAVR